MLNFGPKTDSPSNLMGTSSSKPIMGIGSGGGDINTDLGNLMMNMNSSSNVNPYIPSN